MCQAETVALCEGTTCEGTAQSMMMESLDMPVRVMAEVDNTRAIVVVDRGRSKTLRHIAQAQCVNMGFLHDLMIGGLNVSAEHCCSEDEKADVFTKGMLLAVRSMVGMEPEENVMTMMQRRGQ